MLKCTIPLLLSLVATGVPVAAGSHDEVAPSSSSSSSSSFWDDIDPYGSSHENYDPTTVASTVIEQWERDIQVDALNEALAWATSSATAHHQTRWLQSDFVDEASANRTTPEEICAGYNNITTLECSCRRFGLRDTEVNCTYVEPLCFSDNITCIQPRFSQVLNENVESYVTTTCTTFTNNSTGVYPGESCVRIFPKTNGTYKEIASCSATFTPLVPSADGTQPTAPDTTICHSCSLCTLPNSTVRGIELDCCNVQVDLKQTCGQVSNESGTSIAFFDTVPPDQKGQCTSGATPTRSLAGIVGVVAGVFVGGGGVWMTMVGMVGTLLVHVV